MPRNGALKQDGSVLLSARGLAHSFSRPERGAGKKGSLQALRGVDLDLVQGECLALVGESGSGKTTLVRALLRLIEPTEGEVLYGGEDVLKLSRRELQAFRRKAQIVFQDPFGSLNPRLRAGPMLEEVLKVHDRERGPSARRERVEELLKLVGLHHSHTRRYPHEFSGGQRQRLGIARALSVEPEFLILDEPVSALDLSVQAQILNLLRELQGQLALTVMLVAHDLSVVRQVADRIAVMYLGQLVEVASADEVFGDPRHPYTRGLLVAAAHGGSIFPDSEEWALQSADPPSALHPPEGCGFFSRCPHPVRDQECAEKAPALTRLASARQVACWKEI